MVEDNRFAVTAKVQHFISRYIRSVWQLELLLALVSASKPLNSSEIASILYISKDTIESALKTYTKNGLVKLTNGGYICSTEDPDLLDAIKQTGKAYSERRSSVINLIFTGPRKGVGS